MAGDAACCKLLFGYFVAAATYGIGALWAVSILIVDRFSHRRKECAAEA
jgi:hypothetical protein